MTDGTPKNVGEIATLVREYISRKEKGKPETALGVLESGVRQDNGWWYVPVRLLDPTVQTFQYYDLLAQVEGELDENEHLNILLVPAA